MKKIIIAILILIIVSASFSQDNNYPFEVQKLGQGEKSIVFLHGFGCSGAVWNETVAKYAKDYTCYVLSIAGFAGLEPNDDSSIENWAKSIASFITNMDIEKPIIIGHSLGGMLTLSIAMDYPNLPDRIVVIDGFPCESALFDWNFERDKDLDCNLQGEEILLLSDSAFIATTKYNIEAQLDNKQMFDMVFSWQVRSDRATLGIIYCEMMNFDRRKDLKDIKIPSMILVNSNMKESCKVEIIDQFRHLINSDIRFAEKGNHYIMYDDKDWYFEQLNDFIRE